MEDEGVREEVGANCQGSEHFRALAVPEVLVREVRQGDPSQLRAVHKVEGDGVAVGV